MGKKFDTVQLGLRLAKEVAEDIPAPGLKSALGLASALAEMYDTMRGNKDDLPDLEDRLRALTEINDTSGCNPALKGRLTVLQAQMQNTSAVSRGAQVSNLSIQFLDREDDPGDGKEDFNTVGGFHYVGRHCY
ncbi:hypothetical protein GGX14DRAFT_384152 [Mycena pura]|uniref:Uncharacterized protein n=1 Tax=Mycena pura TaxID=153505 RepID=A0AAD6YV26_9AGAR|nr:hypothetical protein GGX14DRAFT_384152 [Mycena pura]